MINFDDYTLEQLQALSIDLQSVIRARQHAAKREVSRTILEMANTHDIDIEDLLRAKKALASQTRPASAKYANPNNPSETWSGRGRNPLWAKHYVQNGGNLDDCLINKAG